MSERHITSAISVRLLPEAAIEEGIELLAELFKRVGFNRKHYVLARRMFDAYRNNKFPLFIGHPSEFELRGKDRVYVGHWIASFSLVGGSTSVAEAGVSVPTVHGRSGGGQDA